MKWVLLVVYVPAAASAIWWLIDPDPSDILSRVFLGGVVVLFFADIVMQEFQK